MFSNMKTMDSQHLAFECHTLAMDRPAKLRKLHEFRHKVPFASKSALEGFLKTVKDEGLPELITTKNMREASNA